MAIKVEYVKGKTIDKSYVVAMAMNEKGEVSDKKEDKKVFRASKLLDPKLHTVANTKGGAEVPMTPDQLIVDIQKQANTLEEFETVCANMALKHAIEVKATVAVMPDAEPMVAQEQAEASKVEKEPVIAQEGPAASETASTESAPAVKKYFNRLPTKAVGSPEVAHDIQSSLKAAQDQIKILAEEVEKVKEEKKVVEKELDSKKKEGESGKVLDLLSKLGLIEDAKDRETYQKKLMALDEKALGVVESLLKDISDVEGGGHEHAPKPAAPGAPKAAPKAMDKAPMFSSEDNVVTAALHQDLPKSFLEEANLIAEAWMAEDRKKDAILLANSLR